MNHETSFQIINNYYTRAQHRASELLLYNLFKELCETDVDSEKNIAISLYTINILSLCNRIKSFDFFALYTTIPKSKLKIKTS